MNPFKIVITDSGLGGLDVAAKLFEKLNAGILENHIQIIFVNALPETHGGYNKMPDLKTKVNTFNDVLFGIEKHFNPSFIGIACNTLSAISASTAFYNTYNNKLVNIIELGVHAFKNSFGSTIQEPIIVFGTETTILSKAYPGMLTDVGFSDKQIISEVCSQLASEIEFDHSSSKTKMIVEKCVARVVKNLPNKPQDPLFAFLACSHYGYVAEIFKASFANAGYKNVKLINPNDYLVNKLLTLCDKTDSAIEKQIKGGAEIKVYSRCEILAEEIESISKLIQPYSPPTVHALKNYIRKNDLF